MTKLSELKTFLRENLPPKYITKKKKGSALSNRLGVVFDLNDIDYQQCLDTITNSHNNCDKDVWYQLTLEDGELAQFTTYTIE